MPITRQILMAAKFRLQNPHGRLKTAMKTWDILKDVYLISLLHISNENTTYLFEISKCIKYFETCCVALKRIRLTRL